MGLGTKSTDRTSQSGQGVTGGCNDNDSDQRREDIEVSSGRRLYLKLELGIWHGQWKTM